MRKRFFLFFVSLVLQVSLFAAARFWVGGGSSANWSATAPTNWSATSGGSNNATVPGASDDVTFDGAGASGNTASTVSGNITILSLTFTSGYTQTVTINNNVVITIGGNFTDHTAHGWAVGNTVSGITINATSTINSGGKTFPGAVILTGASTKTLSTNDWTVTGNVTVNTNSNKIDGQILNCGANLSFANLPTAGSTKFVMNGTGTLSGGTCPNNLDINTSGTITLGATMNFITGTLHYIAGTVNSSGGILTLTGSCTINTGGMTWNSVAVSTVATITFTSTFLATTFTLSSGAVTFAGSFGFTVGTFNCNQITGISITFVNGVTYTITAAFNCFVSAIVGTAAVLTFTSDHATNKALLTLQNGATCSVIASFTRIDASGGRTINAFHGTLTSTTNILSYTDYNGGGSGSCLFVQ